MNIIQALKENKRPFVLLSNEQQMLIMKAVKCDKVIVLEDNIVETWHLATSIDWNFQSNWTRTYRLRPDYKEEPKVVKCEVKPDTDSGRLCYRRPTHVEEFLWTASSHPDFIGFLYKDGMVESAARRYEFQHGGIGNRVLESADKVEVLTPTHVLFKAVTQG